MPDLFRQTLRQYWGYSDFRGIQRQIIESISAGRDTLGQMPTGGGKSITFQVPALLQEGVCIVITPLVALMKDQAQHLRRHGIRVAVLHAGMSHEQIITALDNCTLGDYKFLYISPERIGSETFQKKLRYMKVSFICVDEAHCISQWGHDFRPAYLQISHIRELLPGKPVLALTASATPKVVNDIQKQLKFKKKNTISMTFERPNLSYIVTETNWKQESLEQLLSQTEGSTIIYTRSRKQCRNICEGINAKGFTATYYHAGLTYAEKSERQLRWQEDKVRIMIATNAFGMGIDKPDVRQVIHVEIPDSIEAYYQEAGRAGRDGKPATAHLIYSPRDLATLKARIPENFPEKKFIQTIYEHICYYYQIAEGFGHGIRREFNIGEFCYNFHHYPVQVHSALCLLTKSGYLEYTEAEAGISCVVLLITREELYRLGGITPQAEQVIRTLLRKCPGIFVTYTPIDEHIIADDTNLTPIQVYQILVQLDKRHILKYIPHKNIPHISFPIDRVDYTTIHIPEEIYERRKQDYTQRIAAITNYVLDNTTCRNKTILKYFGEEKKQNCGQCDVCIQAGEPIPHQQPQEEIKAQVATQVNEADNIQTHDIHLPHTPQSQLTQPIQEMSGDNELQPDQLSSLTLTDLGQQELHRRTKP